MSGSRPGQAMTTLLLDLQAKWRLEQTLVVVGTEFCSKPRINDGDGRDHARRASRCLLAGAGMQRRRGKSGHTPPTGGDLWTRGAPLRSDHAGGIPWNSLAVSVTTQASRV